MQANRPESFSLHSAGIMVMHTPSELVMRCAALSGKTQKYRLETIAT